MSNDLIIRKVYSYFNRNPVHLQQTENISKDLYLQLDHYPDDGDLFPLYSLLHLLKARLLFKNNRKISFKVFRDDDSAIHFLILKQENGIKMNVHLDKGRHGNFVYNKETSSLLRYISTFLTRFGFKTALINKLMDVEAREGNITDSAQRIVHTIKKKGDTDIDRRLKEIERNNFLTNLRSLIFIFKDSTIDVLMEDEFYHVIKRYLKNFNLNNKNTEIFYHGLNINTPAIKSILCDILNDVRVRFCDDTEFLFKLVKVAGSNVDFLTFCLLIRKFAAMNPHFKENFQSVRIFKNLILGVRAGENYKISEPRELRFKLRIFNEFTDFEKTINYIDILNIVCDDYIENRIKVWEFYSLIFMIMDALRIYEDKIIIDIPMKIKETFKIKKQVHISSLFYQSFIEKF